MTAAQLAEHLGVSERTILRDMDVLSVAGIPVVAERGPGGGWTLIEGYRTRLTGLTEEEVQSLFFARPPEAFEEIGFKEASESAWLKLWASLGERERQQAEFVHQRILVDSRGWRDSSKALTALPKLIEALWQNRQARFEYENALHESGERLVHPLGLVAKVQLGIWSRGGTRISEPIVCRASATSSLKSKPPIDRPSSIWRSIGKSRLITFASSFPRSTRPISSTPESYTGYATRAGASWSKSTKEIRFAFAYASTVKRKSFSSHYRTVRTSS